MLIHRAYRYALDPTPNQARQLGSHCGASRVAFNWGLALVKSRLEARSLDPEVEVPWTLPSLRKEWNQAKAEAAPWWAENSKEAYSSGLDALARALKNRTDSKKGHRAGKRVEFPKFKHRTTPSCRFTTGTIRVESGRHHVTLPRIGVIKTHESTRELGRLIESDRARILSATLRYEAGRWFVSFTCEVEREARARRLADEAVAVDLGVKCLAVLSTGEVVPNPHHRQEAQRKIRKLSRQVSRRQGPWDSKARVHRSPSKRWRKATAKLGRAQARVANLRRDGLHKLTTRLAQTYGTVVVEDLNVAGMMGNRRLARQIADAGFGEIRRQLAYKTEWNGGNLVVADRWYPSSKTCSGCGAVKAKLLLSERIYRCEECGLEIDRDLNAALNLASLSDAGAGSGPETLNARGADRKTRRGQVAVKREPGSSGTVEWQRSAAVKELSIAH